LLQSAGRYAYETVRALNFEHQAFLSSMDSEIEELQLWVRVFEGHRNEDLISGLEQFLKTQLRRVEKMEGSLPISWSEW